MWASLWSSYLIQSLNSNRLHIESLCRKLIPNKSAFYLSNKTQILWYLRFKWWLSKRWSNWCSKRHKNQRNLTHHQRNANLFFIITKLSCHYLEIHQFFLFFLRGSKVRGGGRGGRGALTEVKVSSSLLTFHIYVFRIKLGYFLHQKIIWEIPIQ